MDTRILVVDDEGGIRSLLCLSLAKLGFAYDEASNAEKALAKLAQVEYSLLLLDISMPGMSGRELLPIVKSKYPDTAIIMVTALTDTSLAIQCMKEGAYDYISKPFEFASLSSSINRALEKRRLELEVREYREHLEKKVKAQADKIRASFLNAVTSLVYALEARDTYTSGHSHRVTEAALVVANKMGVSESETEEIKLASLVHDIGKIGIKENILNKPGRLTPEEYEHIKEHPKIGGRILEPIVDNDAIISIVNHHHERYDGNGYPDKLKGEIIPLGARILAVVDSFDAMTSERPYRKALPVEKAIKELEAGKGTQFEPSIVDVFVSSITRDGNFKITKTGQLPDNK